MVMSDQQSTTAHSAAIQALTDARQNTRKYVFLMERSDNVSEDAVFVDPNVSDHPQKLAHSAVLDFQREVSQPEYTLKMDNIWQENLTDDAGNDIEIEVPEDNATVRKSVTDGDSSVLPDRSEIDTRTETVSLESLSHRWSGRSITVIVEKDSPYYPSSDPEASELRVWLPPKAIKPAYDQLNSALSKIGLLAQTSAPVEHDPDPV